MQDCNADRGCLGCLNQQFSNGFAFKIGDLTQSSYWLSSYRLLADIRAFAFKCITYLYMYRYLTFRLHLPSSNTHLKSLKIQIIW